MPYVPKEYQLDSGTIVNSGLGYEIRVAAFLSLHCFENSGEEIWLASNPKHVDGFDDIVLHRQLPDATSATYLVQLKHKDKASDITPKEFLKKPHDPKFCPFYLVKYLEHYVALLERMNSPGDQSEIIKHLGGVKNIKFVLFTNRGAEKCDFLESLSDHAMKFLSTSDKGTVYRFRYEKMLVNAVLKANPEFKEHAVNAHFFDNLFLFANQVHMQDSNKLVSDKLLRVLQCKGFAQSDFAQVTDRFVQFVERWAQGELGGNYPLTKTHIANNLVNIFCETYIVRFDDANCVAASNFDLDTWDQITADVPLTVVDSGDLVYNFLGTYVGHKLGQKIEKPRPLSWEKEECLHSQELKDEIRKYVPKNGKPTLLGIYRFLWMKNHLPLVLEIDKVQDYQNIANALKLSNYALRVIIINKSGEALPSKGKSVKQFQTLRDVDETHIRKLMSKAIQLQGRSSVRLQELADDAMLQHITSKDVIGILCGDFSIGNVLEPLPADFIERSVSKAHLDPSVLKLVNDELFVIETKPGDDLGPLEIADSKMCKLGKNSNECNAIITEQLKLENKAIHRLKYDGKLEWTKSYGSVKNIQGYQLEDKDFVPISACNFGTTTILSACPGMGKSLLMGFLAHRAPTSAWVLQIDLSSHLKYYRDPKCRNPDTPPSEHLSHFAKYGCNTKLAQGVFLRLLKAKQVLILMDGFDEVSYSYANEVTNIAKALTRGGYNLWITTRPHMKQHLEDELDGLSITLNPFGMDDQKRFLLSSLNNKSIAVKGFVGELLEATRQNLNDQESKFAAVPLQARFLADAFAQDSKVGFNNNFDLLHLYENFLKRKMDILGNKFGETAKEDYYMFEQHLALFALKLLFPLDEFKTICDDLYSSFYKNEPKNVQLLQRGGIVTIGKDFDIRFVHRTYAEYLSATWLAQNVNEQNLTLRRAARLALNERFDYAHKFLFNVFDRLMAQEHPVHLAIIGGQLDEAQDRIRSSPELANSLDDLNRTLVHMVALYGNYQPSYTFRQHLICINANLGNVMAILNGTPNKCDDLGYSALDYALANGSLLIAEQICAKSDNQTIGVHITRALRDKYFLYCGMLNFRNLFSTLLRYFAHYDLSLGQENTDVYSYATKCQKFITAQQSSALKNLRQYLSESGAKDLLGLFDLQKHGSSEAKTQDRVDVSSAIIDILIDYKDGSKTAHGAIVEGDLASLRAIISNGADLNAQNFDGSTALHYAVLYGNIEMVQLLLDDRVVPHSIQINKQNLNKETALGLAVGKGDASMVKLLLEHGADPNIGDGSGDTVPHQATGLAKTALQLAVSSKHLDIAKLLHQHGANIDVLESDGNTILHQAARSGSLQILAWLLSVQANIDGKNAEQDAPIHCAIKAGHLEAAKLLQAHGADINMPGHDANTVLHLGAEGDLREVISWSLSLGSAEVNKRNAQNDTPLCIAARKGHTAAAKLLRSYGADIDVASLDGSTVLHYAAGCGSEDMVSWLLSLGLHADEQNADHDTPLNIAERKGHAGVARLLQLYGAD